MALLFRFVVVEVTIPFGTQETCSVNIWRLMVFWKIDCFIEQIYKRFSSFYSVEVETPEYLAFFHGLAYKASIGP